MIAFYLPQFHPFPENERFWGKDFTDWTKTTQAKPQFRGHDEPRQPGELGFYDLRVKEVQKRQIELAKAYGIREFCYHHYWFSGKPVMHRPIDQVLDDPELDFPFCLHRANEPWTAKLSWDGCYESGVLLDQNDSLEDDIPFIRSVERALLDKRYIRINGRPLLTSIGRASFLMFEPQLTGGGSTASKQASGSSTYNSCHAATVRWRRGSAAIRFRCGCRLPSTQPAHRRRPGRGRVIRTRFSREHLELSSRSARQPCKTQTRLHLVSRNHAGL